jgi:hypothetical protein
MLRLVLALVLFAGVAQAEPTFQTAGRIGLELPSGFMQSDRFPGFEHPGTGATIIVAELPREAWANLRGTMSDKALEAQNITIESRETVTVAGSDAVLLRGKQKLGAVTAEKWILVVGYPTVTGLVTYQVADMAIGAHKPEEIRAALLSTSFRAPVTIGEQLSTLPFTIGVLDGFRVDRVLGGSTAIIIEEGASAESEPALLVVAASKGGSPPEPERDNFARRAIAGLNIVRDVTVETSAEGPIGGDEGHELIGQAFDSRSGAPVGFVQWLRFRPDGYVRYVGIMPADQRDRLVPMFRKIRDSVEPRPHS